ncbi:hypothetical protein A1O7_06263 [Cladophialophora yegresii CBS 114405]|uniref:Uncharacterized protein n=1 Tax=Cladophialophora yegresii CBS 114405 TaxID=1182544 RepID=W9VTG9_9EURO|nr:uncharacterized protein A1O7_06263 [Cladophialophora yegresii CBS 114405]EXJ58833.1 hypothetical protein A1O7_06263 [Cladophialophora yegresii CBS 114405]
MDVFYTYTYGTAIWLGLQAVPLVVFPKLVIMTLAEEGHQTSDVEIYLSRSLGCALMTVGTIIMFFTGTIPLTAGISEPVSLGDNDLKAPYARPILLVTTFFHSLSFIYCYTSYVNYQQTGFVLGALGYGIMASVGLWTVIFGDTTARLSKRTGADKRTSAWPFKNTQAYDKRKDKKMG